MAATKVPDYMRETNELHIEASQAGPGDVGDPPPSYDYVEWKASGDGMQSEARIERDGRIAVSIRLTGKLPDLPTDFAPAVDEFAVDAGNWKACPRLCIVIMIVGSRGDVQPYVALAKRLNRDGHRVRIASHSVFEGFVLEHGLEFFDIGGDPRELMSYMVKNPGLIPGFASLTNGDIKKKRKILTEMMKGCWLACQSPDVHSGRPFAADAIISNPPAFAHIHCAEALGIPLVMSFTMPWSATGSFPHPLVNLKVSNAGERLSNYMSYALADTITWQGVGDIINNLRTRVMGLLPLSIRTGPDILDRLKVPWTYCMSPGLIPKPADWSNHIDVVGFYFLELSSSYSAPAELANFLAAGAAPVYIGFGSVVVDDPGEMTRVIFEATASAGVRVLLSAGWGGLGGVTVPPHVFLLDNVPHDWLFANDRVSAVVHHGGAGTTAIGLAKGRPTVVVPFFGDQQFWGDMIHRSGAGPAPIPHKALTVQNLKDAVEFAVSPQAKAAAARIAEQIRSEDGMRAGAESFYRHLPLLNMRCDIDPDRVAVWWSTEHCMKLSAFAAHVLIEDRLIKSQQLDLHRTKEYNPHKLFVDPFTAGVTSLFWEVLKYPAGVAEMLYSPTQGLIHTTTAVPKGMMKFWIHVNDGVHKLPTLYGSKVRERAPVQGIADGLSKGGKGLVLGLYDAVTGLVTEPLQGIKQEGVVGGIKGSARSIANLAMKPAAGATGMLGLPMQGLYRSLRLLGTEYNERDRRSALTTRGQEEARACTPAQRKDVLRRFTAANTKQQLEERRKIMLAAAKREVQRNVAAATEPQASESAAGPSTHSGAEQVLDSDDEDERFRRDLERALSLSQVEVHKPAATSTSSDLSDEEAAFLRDLDLAKKLSQTDRDPNWPPEHGDSPPRY